MLIVVQREPEREMMWEQRKIPWEKQDIHCCRGKEQDDMFHGTVQVPLHQQEDAISLLGRGHSFCKFSFFIEKNTLIILDYDQLVTQVMERQNIVTRDTRPAGELLYKLMQGIMENDFLVIDNLYQQLSALEEEIPRDNTRFFLQRMATMKQTVYQMFRYYNQLTELFIELQEYGNSKVKKDHMQQFQKLQERAERLQEDTEILREYAMEIWEIYQSQINIRQNDIMKVLTIVTTIFLPLSLIAGWYGMNFEHMPEIKWHYGYLMAVGLSVFVIVFCMIIFKKKKYW